MLSDVVAVRAKVAGRVAGVKAEARAKREAADSAKRILFT